MRSKMATTIGHGSMAKYPEMKLNVCFAPRIRLTDFFWSASPPIFLEITHYAFASKTKSNIIE